MCLALRVEPERAEYPLHGLKIVCALISNLIVQCAPLTAHKDGSAHAAWLGAPGHAHV
jgi:hypothetical protein